MFRKKSGALDTSVVAPERSKNFPTFRRLLGRFGRWPFMSRAWWKRNKRRMAWLCLVLVAIWTATNIYASVLLNRELEAIRQRGEPLTLAELAPPPVPDAQNAAVLYKHAEVLLEKLGLTSDEEMQMMGRGAQTTPQQLSSVRRPLLQKYRPGVELIRQASRLSLCRFPRPWQTRPAFTILFPELAYLRKFARLMSASAIQEAQDGQTTQAIEDVGTIYRISEHANSDPILIAFLVSTAVEQIGHNALAQVFEYSNLTPSQKSQVEAILPRVDKEQQLGRALRGERAFGLSSFDYVLSTPGGFTEVSQLSGSEAESDNVIISLLWRVGRTLWLPMFKLDEVWFLRSHPANSHPTPLEDVPSYAMLTRTLLPVFDRVHDLARKGETTRNLARIALDLDVYRTQFKTYPATLAQLETQRKTRLPLDFYSGKSFVYRVTKDGYALYSVGPNKVDDGGRDMQDFARSPQSTQQTPGGSSLAPWDDIPWPPSWFTRHHQYQP